MTRPWPGRGERGFTLIELLVVVTIIGVLAAIVSVSVGGFTGQGTIKSRKTSLAAVQSAVDIYLVDRVTGDGFQYTPGQISNTTFSATSSTDWYGTDGKTGPAWVTGPVAGSVTFPRVDIGALTSVVTTTVGGIVNTHGPYLRTTSNAITCIYAGSVADLTGDGTLNSVYKVVACKDAG